MHSPTIIYLESRCDGWPRGRPSRYQWRTGRGLPVALQMSFRRSPSGRVRSPSNGSMYGIVVLRSTPSASASSSSSSSSQARRQKQSTKDNSRWRSQEHLQPYDLYVEWSMGCEILTQQQAQRRILNKTAHSNLGTGRVATRSAWQTHSWPPPTIVRSNFCHYILSHFELQNCR